MHNGGNVWHLENLWRYHAIVKFVFNLKGSTMKSIYEVGGKGKEQPTQQPKSTPPKKPKK